MPRTIRKANHQTGKTHIVEDIQRLAGTPGMRVSRHGKPYYEGRKNRSDVNPAKRI